MPDIDIDKLQIEVSASSEDATKKIRKLASSMRSLKKALAETNGVNSLANSLRSLSSAIKDAGATVEMANAIKSIGRQEAKIGNVADYLLGISKMDFSNLTSASNVIGELAEIAASVKATKITAVGKKSDTTSKVPVDLGEEESTRASRALAISLEWILDASNRAISSIGSLSATIGKTFLRAVARATGATARFYSNLITTPFRNVANSIQRTTTSFNRFTSSIGRIALYRAIRTAMKDITQGVKEGMDNLSAYSRLINTEFHRSLDGIVSDALYVKNSFATVAAPIVNFVKPAFDALADSIANALNMLAEFMARMTGAASYSKAIKFNTEYGDSIQKAGEKAKKAKLNLLGIDELNIFQEPISGASGGFSADDYSKMFEEVKLDTEQFSLANEIKFAIEHDGWTAAGEVLAAKLNGLIKDIDVSSLGKQLGGKINNAISFAYGFLDGTSFVKIGEKVATFLNSTFSEINFETIGRIFTRKFTALFDFIIGFVSTLNWKQVGKAVGDYLRGAFNEISDWSKTVNWSEFGRNLWRDVRDFIKGIDFGSLARSFFSLLGSAFAVAVRSIGGFFSGVWEDVREYFRRKTEEAGGDTWEGFKKGVKNAWSGVKNWVKTNISDPFVTSVKELFGIRSFSTLLYGIGESIIAGLKNGLLSKWNELKLWWSKQELPSFKVKLPHLSWSTTPASGWISKTLSALGLPTSLPKLNVAWYAKGGFPEDGLFYANHNELVGQFSNGRTAVANNEQIVEGIRAGVSDANEDLITVVASGFSQIIRAIEGNGNGSFDLDGAARMLYPYIKNMQTLEGASFV